MDDCSLKIGSIVKSLKGRDCGKYFLVLKTADKFAFVADGYIHMLAKPKKKNIKHLHSCNQVLTVIAEKLVSGKKVFDSEVAKALRNFNENLNT